MRKSEADIVDCAAGIERDLCHVHYLYPAAFDGDIAVECSGNLWSVPQFSGQVATPDMIRPPRQVLYEIIVPGDTLSLIP